MIAKDKFRDITSTMRLNVEKMDYGGIFTFLMMQSEALSQQYSVPFFRDFLLRNESTDLLKLLIIFFIGKRYTYLYIEN